MSWSVLRRRPAFNFLKSQLTILQLKWYFALVSVEQVGQFPSSDNFSLHGLAPVKLAYDNKTCNQTMDQTIRTFIVALRIGNFTTSSVDCKA